MHFFLSSRCKVSSIKQEILSISNRVSHPNLTHYLAVNVQESAPTVNVQVISSTYTVILNFQFRWPGLIIFQDIACNVRVFWSSEHHLGFKLGCDLGRDDKVSQGIGVRTTEE